VSLRFNNPPGWPDPEPGWQPPKGWAPDPSWPPAPAGWAFWVADDAPPVPPPVEVLSDAPTVDAPVAESVVAPAAAGVITSEPVSSGNASAVDADVAHLLDELAALRAQVAHLTEAGGTSAAAAADVVELDDERVLQEVGIYRYHHPLENSEAYRDKLKDLQERVKDMIKAGDAILASEMFTFDNSLAKGRKMTSDLSKLMLRAYNSEADNCVRALRAGNVVTAKKRLEASVTSIQKLGSMMEMRVNPDYHALRIDELELTADYLMKVQEEKEAAREERERLREERKAEQELAAERERLDKERSHYLNALAALKANGDDGEADELEAKLAELDEAIAQNDYRTANIRAGYVYVISNEGAFGRGVVKIGMTRRLDPMDRVRELGDASVPFPYDVHALQFVEDAITLENELHKHFAARKVNQVNERREFFFATPEEVREVLSVKAGNLLEYTEKPEATQYHQSRGAWPKDVVRF
jgi:hypothetical protein